MITEKMLADAAAELNEAMLASLPDPSECVHVFSRAFERKMKHIIRKANHPVIYRLGRAAACFLLVFLLGLGSLMAVSPTVRAAVVGWVKEQYETFTSYFFQGGDMQTGTEDYELSEIPAGYTLLKRIDVPGSSTIIYVNDNHQFLQINYSSNPALVSITVAHDSHVHSTVTIGDIIADLYTSVDPKQSTALVWEYNNYLFYISGFLSEEELIDLAEDLMNIG